MGATLKKPLRRLAILLLCYPLGCAGFVGTCSVVDGIAAREDARLFASIPDGMTPAEVERVTGRPSEYTVKYAQVQDDEQFSRNWTVDGRRVEVVFLNGRVRRRHTFPAEPGPARQFFAVVFFWWAAPFVSGS